MDTIERLAKVEADASNLKEINSKEHNDLKELIVQKTKRIEDKLDKFIDKTPSLYASKWTERLVWVVLTGTAGLLLDRIFGGVLTTSIAIASNKVIAFIATIS